MTSGQRLRQTPSSAPPLGTRPVPAASASRPACKALARRGAQGRPAGQSPSGDGSVQRTAPGQGHCLAASRPRERPQAPLLCQLFLRTRKEAGSVDVKIEAPASQDRPGGGRPHVFLLQAGPRHAWCGQGACWDPLPLSCTGTPRASVPGGARQGPRGFRAGTALRLLRGFCKLEPPPAGRSFLPGLAEAG